MELNIFLGLSELQRVEVPEGAKGFYIRFIISVPYELYTGKTILFPEKERKWRWLLRHINGDYCVSSSFKTEKEAYSMWNGKVAWGVVSKVEETEIEE